MLNYLTTYKDELQTLAQIASFLASLGILIATIVYVRYTRTMAAATAEQAHQSRLASEAQTRTAELAAVCQYFQQGDTPEQQAIRRRLWRQDGSPIDADDASQVASFWHFWGLMVEKGLLPLWVFQGSSGTRVVQYYSKLESHIQDMRRGNPNYAEHFETLRNRVGGLKLDSSKTKGL